MSFDPHTTHRQEGATLAGSATLTLHDKQYEFPVISGTSGLNVIDITKLHGLSGAFTYDPGFASTASCKSNITFNDGERGILAYRGYPIEQLAEHSTYLETCHILLYGDLPTSSATSISRTASPPTRYCMSRCTGSSRATGVTPTRWPS